MCGKQGVGIVIGLVGLMTAGCASTSAARYVYQDNQFGVVAIPENTSQGRTHYREQAEVLMSRHFPTGYEIVRAEEIVAGSRTLTVGKTGTTEITPQIAPHLLALLKVGGSTTRSQADTINLKECRIIYKKKTDLESAITSGGFGPVATLTPTCYVDPNVEARKQDKEKEKEKEQAKLVQAKKDLDAVKAGDMSASP